MPAYESHEDLKLNVKMGCHLMDEVGPQGWRNLINTDTLVMSSPTSCVIGQTFKVQTPSEYSRRLKELMDAYYGTDRDISDVEGQEKHGFNLQFVRGDFQEDNHQMWVDAIKEGR